MYATLVALATSQGRQTAMAELSKQAKMAKNKHHKEATSILSNYPSVIVGKGSVINVIRV